MADAQQQRPRGRVARIEAGIAVDMLQDRLRVRRSFL
jgi:hypothetical protein